MDDAEFERKLTENDIKRVEGLIVAQRKVVAKERQKLEDLETELAELEDKL